MTRILPSTHEAVPATVRKRLSEKDKHAVVVRQGMMCLRCGHDLPFMIRQSGVTFLAEFDHRVPIELGGSNGLDNIECLDLKCHKLKTKSDIRAIAKARRLRAKNDPNAPPRKAKRSIQSRPFPKRAHPGTTEAGNEER